MIMKKGKIKKTKIVCTLGPATESAAVMQRLIEAGMNAARLNFSHGSRDEHAAHIKRIRKAAAKTGKEIAIISDLAGPKIRIGEIARGTVTLETGRTFTLTNLDVAGDETEVSINYKKLPGAVRKGDRILLSDGGLELEVVAPAGNKIVCRVISGGLLSSRQGINLPSRTTGIPILTDKDKQDLEFALRQEVDYIGISFVRTAEDVKKVKRLIKSRGNGVGLIAKIEKPQALRNLAAIIKEVDGIMIARGDLGVEIPFEEVPLAQKNIIREANLAGKPVITATQMMESMVSSPRPSRSEVSDVANAVLEGTDAIMLSEESAIGKYPVEAVAAMSRIVREVETFFPAKEWTRKFQEQEDLSVEEYVARAACGLSEDIDADCLITHTSSGSAARRVAKYRPFHHIIAATADPKVCRRLALVWGVYPILIAPLNDTEVMIAKTTEAALKAGLLKKGERVVITAGIPLNRPGHTNVIRVITAGESDKTF